MKLANLELFEDVYRRGSLSAVARSRNVAPSVISRAISGLEAELGTLLFYRTTRKIAPTEAASLLMQEVEQHLDALRSLRTTLSDKADAPGGVLRISASHAFGIHCLGSIIPAFCRAYPGVRIDLTLTDQLVDIVGERFDLALRHGPLGDSSMIAMPVLRTRYHMCASPAYLAAMGHPREPGEISGRNCLTFPLPGFSDVWRLRDAEGHEHDIPVRSGMSVNSGIVLRDCALQGLGIVLLSDWLIGADLAAGRLIDLFPDHVATPSNFQTVISAVYPNRTYTPRNVKLFIAFLQQNLASALAMGPDILQQA
ncbi:LysR family transcriptional regulator [Sphingobium nicotianae]|uniref:LysR family transcriptional regulator n=1 Tax=Sphingobium nicotianae TaxID=2782607 RepID=A0A9X1AIP0_9SPHN|nr:LysR family transcriptional regulator [Sphingobium nicotianae]MBT2185410.1 LysR family transcriptional regulator [Sphingobium nicotianae]